MQILLTNDDGIYAPGLRALEQELRQVGDLTLVAPASEQSGVGHSITFLNPLICHEVFEGDTRRGWAVEGSPADCVKLGVLEFCGERPDLVVSGINGGLNAGINVLYSGTVAAAIEGAFFGITSVAVSLEFDEHANYEAAAIHARKVIEGILAQKSQEPDLFNLNIPTTAIDHPRGVKIASMGLSHYGEQFIKRQDPKGRDYYWAAGDLPVSESETETDLAALAAGYMTLTPLQFDMTKQTTMHEMKQWKFPD